MNEIFDVFNLNESEVRRIIRYLEDKHGDSLPQLLREESKQYVIRQSLTDYAQGVFENMFPTQLPPSTSATWRQLGWKRPES